ncbi:MAG: FAD-dependent oxidoreductase [Phycisphaerales bacterium]|nr:FAD-dependent oxidoreductase [Phycisphaerales bacterium]
MAHPTRIVILGGGFAGVYTARHLLRLGGDRVQVHLVNRENYLVFQPMLPEVISGSVGIADTTTPIRRLIPRAHLHMRDVEGVDLAERHVICSPGFQPRPLVLPYDHLVIALGNVTDFRGLPGLAEHAMPFKTHGDALALRNHVIRILEEADAETRADWRARLLTFVVAGGGFSGVEVVAELHDFVRRALRSYPTITRAMCRFVLLHSRERILPEVDEKLALYAQNLLRRRGIEIMLGARLAAATSEHAALADGTKLACATLVATVPSHPNPLCEALDLPSDRGRIIVDEHLRVQGQGSVWALGDCALVPLPGAVGERAYAPPTAQHAIREARVAAANILAAENKRPLQPFAFKGLGSLCALGHRRGVAQVMGVRLAGFPAWFLWRTVYWSKLPGIQSKVRVGLSWLLDLFLPPDIVQLRVGRSSGINHEHFEPGQAVFEQGDLGDRVYIIIRGRADVERRDEQSGQAQVLASLEAGHYFGEMALLNRAPRNATVRCVEPMDVLSIEKGEFGSLITHLDVLRQQFEQTAQARREPMPPAKLPTALPKI